MTDLTTRAVRLHEHGGPEVLRIEDVPIVSPGPGEVLVRHEAIGLNFIDTYFRTGLYPVPLPTGPGNEAAGVVEAVGPGVYPFKTSGIGQPYKGLPADSVERIKRGEIAMEVDWVRVYQHTSASR